MGCLHTSRWFLLFLQAFTPCWTMQSIVQYDYEQRPFLNTKYNFSYTRGVPRHTKEIAKRYFFRMPIYGKAGALRRQPSTSTNRNQVITDTLSPRHFRQSSPRTYP